MRLPRQWRSIAIFVTTTTLTAMNAGAATVRIMTTGLGTGTVTSPAGACPTTGGPACDVTFTSPIVLTASPGTGSHFVRWFGDCTSAGNVPTCTVPAGSDARVRAQFDLDAAITEITDFTPEGIDAYLGDMANAHVNTPARFLKALPREFRQNWILMSRSESLQPGTALVPRFLLPSADARFTFTFGFRTETDALVPNAHRSYPAAHQNAIEYMQWDGRMDWKTFRFHEIVLDTIPALRNFPPSPRTPRELVGVRNRGVSPDDKRCFQCHSTRNVLNRTGLPGTTGDPIGSVPWKNKPNWDAYDSWGGMLPFNRDRIYKGSVEAAAFRKLFNPWTWRNRPDIRAFIEQLELQPETLTGIPPRHAITRINGGPNDGHVGFAFDGPTTPPPVVLNEPEIAGIETTPPNPATGIGYAFNGAATVPDPMEVVQRGGDFVLLHDSVSANDEGRGVEYFDRLGGADGGLNAQRIADEINRHRFATGSAPIDVRPIALAITNDCLTVASVATLPTAVRTFFDTRNGMTIADMVADLQGDRTNPENRTESLPRRKADIEKLNLDRTDDPYLMAPENGLIRQYGATTFAGTSTTLPRLRQEVFRRPRDLGANDSTPMGGFFVDRERYDQNTQKMALFRYFLEPLGVSVDKWSMGVRGRSRTYTFADVFVDFPPNSYIPTFRTDIAASLDTDRFPGLAPPFTCTALTTAVDTIFSSLPAVDDIPRYTDIQRIFNKGCIECHGGLGYPPFDILRDADYLDLSEDEVSTTSRLLRSFNHIQSYGTGPDPMANYLFRRIVEGPEKCPDPSATSPAPRMPCGGPPLSQTDIETLRRWLGANPHPFTVGDPHIRTVDGTEYDFQAAGEFVLLRDVDFEMQARQTPVPTVDPVPNAHAGLSACVSLNTAIAFRVGPHRVTYQPDLSGRPSPEGLQLRVDGKPVKLDSRGYALPSGGRIITTPAAGGIQVETGGGTEVVVTPGFWDDHQVWYLNVDVRRTRATEGVMGSVARLNWLPALPNGTFLGPRPSAPAGRYQQLYGTFAGAWRVDDQTTLFDYAPGTSTRDYTLTSWPGYAVRTCKVPPGVLGAPVTPPLPPLPLAVAKQHCARIVDASHRRNCEQDVMVTGEPAFADTYLAAEGVTGNARPAAPVLLYPEREKIDVPTTVTFTWKATADQNGDPVTYLQCVWEAGETPTFNHCTPLEEQTKMAGGAWRSTWLWVLLVVLIVLLKVVLFRKLKVLALALGVVALAATLLATQQSGASSPAPSHTVEGLKPGRTYFWKVIAQDGKGGTIESETRRFVTKR